MSSITACRSSGSGESNSTRRPSPRVRERRAAPSAGTAAPAACTARRSCGDAPVHAAVGRVADDRMADGAQVHADLMGAAGRDRHLQQRHALEVARPRDARHRAPRAARAGRHLLPLLRIAADRRVDPLARPGPRPRRARRIPSRPRDRGTAATAPGAPRSFLATTIRPDVPRSSRCTMPGPQLAADAAQILDVVQQRVDERAAGCARRRVDDHPRRLVEHDDVRILVDDAERQRLRLRSGGGRARACRRRRSVRRGPRCWAAACGTGPCTRPSLISRWTCDRDCSGRSAVRKWSSRMPSCSGSTSSSRREGGSCSTVSGRSCATGR